MAAQADSTSAPLVIAGGPKMKSDLDILNMVYDSLQAGGKGVSIGRNIFQHQDVEAMTRAIFVIVHRGATVKEACQTLGCQ